MPREQYIHNILLSAFRNLERIFIIEMHEEKLYLKHKMGYSVGRDIVAHPDTERYYYATFLR